MTLEMEKNLIDTVYLQIILRHYKRLICAVLEVEQSVTHLHNA